MNAIDTELEDLGLRAAALELYSAEPDSPPWMRRQDAERAAQLRERQYLLLSGMRKCAAEGCHTLVAGSAFCPSHESELNHAFRLASLCARLPRVPLRAGVYLGLLAASVTIWTLLILLLLYLWRLIP